ncbi:MAG: serine hydrolase domain-containing protein [Lachnospiraceae bacterium]
MNEYLGQFIENTKKDNLNVMYAQIWQEGKLIEEYKRMPVKTRLNTWSACKGVVSCAFGIAQGEGLIRLNEHLVDLFPEYIPEDVDGYISEVTLEHMLTMTTGLESSLFFCDWPERYTTPDWIEYFFKNARFVHKPGEEWLYSNFNTFIISCAIEKRAGCNLLEYLRHRFFEKIEIGNPDWTLSPKGHVHAANGLYVTIDELSRYGELIKNKGMYKGIQVVPKEYMERATSNLVQNPAAASNTNTYAGYGYGYQFVMNPEPGSYRSDGNYGQFCLAYPEQDIVITVMSLEGEFEKIGNYLWKDVVANVIK